MKDLVETILAELHKEGNAKKAAFFPKFFKTGVGEYGYGDKFLGVTVPAQRKIANTYYKMISENEITSLLASEFHEVRLTSLLMLVNRYQQKANSEADKLRYINLYKSNLDRVNNWDLVDLTAYKILGDHYFRRERSYLHKLSKSKDLWECRIGVIATFYFIRNLDFEDTIQMCERLLTHKHDLIHKATGWMLREIGKRDTKILRDFLEEHVTKMPRTMLRYAIEKLPEKERKMWLDR
jgi:3-methyladenine DNA glycosylase AlkD